MSHAKMERQYLTECFPGKLEKMTRKPEDFLKYANGRRCPRSHQIERSPLHWALARYPGISDTYNSFLFASMRSSNDEEALYHLSSELYHSKSFVREALFHRLGGLRATGAGLRLWLPIGLCPRDAIQFLKHPEFDALAALVIATKTNEGGFGEEQCALLVVEWVQSWAMRSTPPNRLLDSLIQALSENLPVLRGLFFGAVPWTGLRADLHHPCFAE
ncbi:MAG: hypothetical protein LWW96_20480 [Acidovorax sp.]|uniref:hypothetical protein n=1 Tax=Acidovorax sp. TaxID=1872122 RepID=UPI0025C0FD2F|nr:hypothetical protein [Acidovorax sp.]MCE1194529.1 hypothetical protein [Acidovorax sp.]